MITHHDRNWRHCPPCLVDGHVQGVGYREFTRRAALSLGVSGWVRNRSDGAVEALICGPPAAVEALVAEMRKGHDSPTSTA